MASYGLVNLIEKLDYKQWSAIMQAEFREILAIRTKLIPKTLDQLLLEKYEP